MLRTLLAALALACGAGMAHADELPLPDEERTLACLVRGGPALSANAVWRLNAQGVPAYVRVRLLFQRADQPPTVEVLASTAATDARNAVLAHVAGYRLPCLAQRPLAVVQEFQLAPDLAPQGSPLWPVTGPATADRTCIVRGPAFAYSPEPRVVDRMVMAFTYSGDGDAAPEVAVLGTNGDDQFTKFMVKHGREWRQPCRKVGDWPHREEVAFQVSMAGTHPAEFKKKRVALSEFLGYMKDVHGPRRFFDFDSMQCPFTLRWTLHEPWGRNRVREVEGENPNRVALIEWLRGLHSGLDPSQMSRLIGQSLTVEVPCGTLNLPPVRP